VVIPCTLYWTFTDSAFCPRVTFVWFSQQHYQPIGSCTSEGLCFEFLYTAIVFSFQGLCRDSGGLSPSFHHEDLGLTPSMRKWWTDWHWERFFEPLGFPFSVLIHQCCIHIFWSEGEAIGALTEQFYLWHPAAMQQCVRPASLAARQPPFPPTFVRRMDLCLCRRFFLFCLFVFWLEVLRYKRGSVCYILQAH
jgi:hypothetical protein